MNISFNALEYHFVIPEKTVSFRSPNAKRYKIIVRHCARPALPRRPLRQALKVRLDYFHSSQRRVDMDNVAKCVIDALNGLVYVDDRFVRLQSAIAHDLRRPVKLRGGPVDLVKPLRKYTNYLFVRIRVVT